MGEWESVQEVLWKRRCLKENSNHPSSCMFLSAQHKPAECSNQPDGSCKKWLFKTGTGTCDAVQLFWRVGVGGQSRLYDIAPSPRQLADPLKILWGSCRWCNVLLFKVQSQNARQWQRGSIACAYVILLKKFANGFHSNHFMSLKLSMQLMCQFTFVLLCECKLCLSWLAWTADFRREGKKGFGDLYFVLMFICAAQLFLPHATDSENSAGRIRKSL